MIVRLFILLLLAITGPSLAGAAVHTLEIQLSFDASAVQDKTVTGYTLYQDSLEVCVTADPTVTVMACQVEATDGTHIYELAARYSDGTYSPKSPPFEFVIGASDDTNPPPPTSNPPPDTDTGNYLISYSWESTSQDSTLAGYRMYMNDILVCETSDTTISTLSCYADLINEIMNFSIASYDTSNIESLRSNFLTLDPVDFPELFLKKILTFTWQYTDGTSNAGGFQVYDNGELLCATPDSTARSLTCTIEQLQFQHSFTLAAVSDTGVISTFSNAIVYNDTSGDDIGTDPNSTQLAAAITPSTTKGTAPLAISFDGTSSTGAITAYSWDFGDGDSGNGATASHTYSIAGTYTATLQVTADTGAIAIATTSITVEDPPIVLNPPTAVISSTSASGEAPLNVTFNGADSTTGNGSIISYDWDLGDGTKAIGTTASHIYSTAGTYHVTLLVTDEKGLTDTESTPIVVTEATVINEPPTASFSSTPTEGTTPLTILFDGSPSTDYDGIVVGYNWNFGDGTTGSGQTVQHTYTTAATYTVTLQVVDDLGAKSTISSKTITVDEAQPDIILNYEIGELALTSDWVKVSFENSFTNPAVFISPPSYNGKDPVLTRVRNVTSTGFEVRLQEYQYLDDTHALETVNFIVLEQGITILPDGGFIEVGSFNAKTNKQTIPFKQSFPAPPVVLTNVFTMNENDAVIHKAFDITNTGFVSLLQEQQSTKNKHVDESVAYLAWSKGEYLIDTLAFKVTVHPVGVTHEPTTIQFSADTKSPPFFYVEQQTLNGGDTAAIRITQITSNSATLFLEEEQSKDSETNHIAENFGYILITLP